MPEFIPRHTPLIRKLSDVSSKYGAPMGRGSDPNPSGKVTLERVILDEGGYDSGGAYWGRDKPLWRGTTAEGDEFFARGKTRADVEKDYPSLTFIQPSINDMVDEMVCGYLDCAEWLLDEEIDRDEVRGWSVDAKKDARADCQRFVKANFDDLKLYCEISGRNMECAGHDFWLSRNGHGTGFWDRGKDDVFKRLHDATKIGETNVYVHRGWMRFD